MDVAFDHIMVATDLGETSHGAAQAAELLATRFGARVTLWHGCAAPLDMPPPLASREPPSAQREARALQALAALRCGPLGGAVDVDCETEVTGSLTSALCSAAEQHAVDLVVVVARARRLGSVAERVVRHAGCAVLVVPADATLAAGTLRRVDVATDLSPPALLAADAGVALGRRFGAACALVNVLAYGDGVPWSLQGRRDTQALRRSELSALARARFPEEALEVDALLAPRAHDAIVQRAVEQGIDVVVLGAVGCTGIERMLLGSVAERIARACPCAVWIAR